MSRRVPLNQIRPPQLEGLPASGDSATQGRDGSFTATKPWSKSPIAGVNLGDYLNVLSHNRLRKIILKQGDKQVYFSDKIMKVTGSGKMKRRILIITDFAIYIIDPDTTELKRRIAVAAAEKVCLSKLSDNFVAIVIPTEYDLLMASRRKNEIVKALVDAMKSTSGYELEVNSSNRFEYNAAADLIKEVQFEQVEGGIKTRILRK